MVYRSEIPIRSLLPSKLLYQVLPCRIFSSALPVPAEYFVCTSRSTPVDVKSHPLHRPVVTFSFSHILGRRKSRAKISRVRLASCVDKLRWWHFACCYKLPSPVEDICPNRSCTIYTLSIDTNVRFCLSTKPFVWG